MAKNTSKLGGRIWFNVILFGFMGQIAWAVENFGGYGFQCAPARWQKASAAGVHSN